jgi:fermentation-respiration switch protein FrsA (DUF1100 family)
VFEPFPGNYVWNLSINLALMAGGNHGELDEVCRPVRDAAARNEDAGSTRLFESWLAVANKVVAMAEADLARGRRVSAGIKFQRASGYLLGAERMQSRDHEPRRQAYEDGLRYFRLALELRQDQTEFVDIPYEGRHFPALFAQAPRADDGRPRPCVVLCNGLDSMKEQAWMIGLPQAFAMRGISTLVVDQPGSGEALRRFGLAGRHDAEAWATPAYDYLLTRSDVDHARIGMVGGSLGGHFAPRAVAMDPRFTLCAVLGANSNWGEMQKRRLAREGDRPVPHYWDHVMWVFGKKTLDEFMAWAPCMDLSGVLEKIRVPFLVTHAAGDRQIPVEYARQSYDAAVHSPKRELFITTKDHLEVEHFGADNGTISRDYVADWLQETFAEM